MTLSFACRWLRATVGLGPAGGGRRGRIICGSVSARAAPLHPGFVELEARKQLDTLSDPLLTGGEPGVTVAIGIAKTTP